MDRICVVSSVPAGQFDFKKNEICASPWCRVGCRGVASAVAAHTLTTKRKVARAASVSHSSSRPKSRCTVQRFPSLHAEEGCPHRALLEFTRVTRPVPGVDEPQACPCSTHAAAANFWVNSALRAVMCAGK